MKKHRIAAALLAIMVAALFCAFPVFAAGDSYTAVFLVEVSHKGKKCRKIRCFVF